MVEDHQAFLQRLEAQAREKQQAFMNNIASRLKRPRITEQPEHPFRGAPDFWRDFEWSEEERVAHFTENFQNVGGYVVRLSSMEEAKRFIVNKAEELGAKYVIRQDEQELADLLLEQELKDTRFSVWNTDEAEYWKARAAEADIGIVMADYAAAYTGSLTVLSAKHKGRSVSLLPTLLMAILPKERITTKLGDILERFDHAGRELLPAGIHFISGPSRSADIENDLTIGVHGPGKVFAIIIG